MTRQTPTTIAQARARIMRLTQMLNLMDQDEAHGLTERSRQSFRRERDRTVLQLQALVAEELARGESADGPMRPFGGDDQDDRAQPLPVANRHWPAPRHCASPECSRELPADARPNRMYCGPLCSGVANRRARGVKPQRVA